jgi:amino acid transporter
MLSKYDATGIAISHMIGGGIFVLIGLSISEAKEYVWISIIFALVCSLFTAHSYNNLNKVESKIDSEHISDYINKDIGTVIKYLLVLSTIIVSGTLAISIGEYAKNINSNLDIRIVASISVILCCLLVGYGLNQVVILSHASLLLEVLTLVYVIVYCFVTKK